MVIIKALYRGAVKVNEKPIKGINGPTSQNKLNYLHK